MQVMTDNDPYRSAYSATNPQWSPNPHIYPHSHNGTPVHEYSAFNFATSPDSTSQAIMHRRPLQPQLPTLVMPQWPSMLNSQSSATYTNVYAQPGQSGQPAQPVSISAITTPSSATSARSSSTPRKTLTDSDRKRMCQYAEEHPHSKQTDIGAIFGVERSTVSKVLRQKEKYLFQDDGSKSPIKRAKGRSPDIERALANWAKNQERKGLPLTDEAIQDKARAFAATTTTPDNHIAMSASWIEKFKLRNNLMGARSRKSSINPDDGLDISAIHSATPSSPAIEHSPHLRNAPSSETLDTTSPGNTFGFVDTAPSSFSPAPLSPTSPFFTPDSGVASGPFPSTGLNINLNSQRPRSQTFPQLDQYLLATSAECQSSKYSTVHVLDSPMEELVDPIVSMSEVVNFSRPHTITPTETMGPPPLPIAVRDRTRSETPAGSVTPSPDEARHALQVVMGFLEQQPQGFLDHQESVTLGKLTEKLKLIG